MLPLHVVQFDVAALDVLEGDGNVTLDIKKTEQVNFDFDVIVIPVPFTAGKFGIHSYVFTRITA